MRLNFFSLICVRVKGIRDPPFFHHEGTESAIGVFNCFHTARDTDQPVGEVGDQAYLCAPLMIVATCVKSLKYTARSEWFVFFSQDLKVYAVQLEAFGPEGRVSPRAS